MPRSPVLLINGIARARARGSGCDWISGRSSKKSRSWRKETKGKRNEWPRRRDGTKGINFSQVDSDISPSLEECTVIGARYRDV